MFRIFLLLVFNCVPPRTTPYQNTQNNSTIETNSLDCSLFAQSNVIIPQIEFINLDESNILNTSMSFKANILHCGEAPALKSLSWTIYNRGSYEHNKSKISNYFERGYSLISKELKDIKESTALPFPWSSSIDDDFFHGFYSLGSNPEVTIPGINSKAKENDNSTHNEEFFLELSLLLENDLRLYTRAYIHIDVNFNPLTQGIQIWTAPISEGLTAQNTLNFSCAHILSYVQNYSTTSNDLKCQALSTTSETPATLLTEQSFGLDDNRKIILPTQNKEPIYFLQVIDTNDSNAPLAQTKFLFMP